MKTAYEYAIEACNEMRASDVKNLDHRDERDLATRFAYAIAAAEARGRAAGIAECIKALGTSMDYGTVEHRNAIRALAATPGGAGGDK